MKFSIKIPATTANFGPGFDVLGMALGLYNEIEVSEQNSAALKFNVEVEGEGSGILPEGALPLNETNVVVKAIKKVFGTLKHKPSLVNLKLVNRIPLARGMGSSAAAIAGGVIAANRLCGNKLSTEEVFRIAAGIEGHPDNVAPAIYGGLCISYSDASGLKCERVSPPEGIDFIVCIPDFELSTEKARKLLPSSISMGDAVFNISRTALLMEALINRKHGLLATATADRLHQPYRKKLIPGFDEIVNLSLKKGALGVFLSGSGPTIMALAPGKNARKSNAIASVMSRVFEKHGINSKTLILPFDKTGARII